MAAAMRVRVMPVLVACRGCGRDTAAWQVALELDRRGHGEAVQPGDADKVRSRYPVYVIEGCAEACGKRWLATSGVEPAASFVLDPQRGLEQQVEEISAAVSRA